MLLQFHRELARKQEGKKEGIGGVGWGWGGGLRRKEKEAEEGEPSSSVTYEDEFQLDMKEIINYFCD